MCHTHTHTQAVRADREPALRQLLISAHDSGQQTPWNVARCWFGVYSRGLISINKRNTSCLSFVGTRRKRNEGIKFADRDGRSDVLLERTYPMSLIHSELCEFADSSEDAWFQSLVQENTGHVTGNRFEQYPILKPSDTSQLLAGLYETSAQLPVWCLKWFSNKLTEAENDGGGSEQQRAQNQHQQGRWDLWPPTGQCSLLTGWSVICLGRKRVLITAWWMSCSHQPVELKQATVCSKHEGETVRRRWASAHVRPFLLCVWQSQVCKCLLAQIKHLFPSEVY